MNLWCFVYNAKTCVTDAADTQRRWVFETVWELLKSSERTVKINESNLSINQPSHNLILDSRYISTRYRVRWCLATVIVCFTVAPCLSDAPANGSISGFSSGRVRTVRSGSGDALEFVAPIEADVSGVRSNATGYCLCLYAWCGCEWCHVVEFYNTVYLHYIHTRTPEGGRSTVKSIF